LRLLSGLAIPLRLVADNAASEEPCPA